jgi:diguanylate cyclase (GGDEF)-like protein/PAS domain S-box-containing protein
MVEVVQRWATRLANTKGVSLDSAQLSGMLEDLVREATDEAETARRAAQLRFSALYSTAPIGIALTDSTGFVVQANAALGKLLGCRPELLEGQHLAALGSTERDATTLRVGLDEMGSMELDRYQQRVLLAHAEDVPVWADITLTRLPGDQPGSSYPVLMVQDANEVHLLQETLRHQNIHDPLTGLANTSSFRTKLEATLGTGAEEQVALVYLDIDGFKVVNDGLGAGVGDQVLRGVAAKVAAVFTEHDGFVARLSGDGFAILMRGALTPSEVIALVERTLEDLAEPIYLGDHGIGISASAGIVVRDVSEGGPEDLLRGAEIALHRAKESGKAQWMLFDPELDARDRARYRLGAVIAGALENGEFSLLYKPTFRLSNPDRLAAVSVGLRWNHPEQGPLESEDFLPLAETTGMTVPLGRWLLTEALAANARWRGRYGDEAPDVCIQLPKRLAIDPDLVLLVKEQLDRQELPGKALRLCTDSSALLDPRGEVLESLAVLSDLGAQLVLTVSGSADLELIPAHRLPVRHVILTGAVIDGLVERADESATRHLGQLIERARELNLRIGAEGVRHEDHAARLREFGVLAARGPFVVESVTGEEVDELIARHST